MLSAIFDYSAFAAGVGRYLYRVADDVVGGAYAVYYML